jgi:hypothetical protein
VRVWVLLTSLLVRNVTRVERVHLVLLRHPLVLLRLAKERHLAPWPPRLPLLRRFGLPHAQPLSAHQARKLKHGDAPKVETHAVFFRFNEIVAMHLKCTGCPAYLYTRTFVCSNHIVIIQILI